MAAAQQFATENNVDLRTIELGVASQESADQAIKAIVEKDGRLDVVIHNAGHMVYDTNGFSTQRVNRAALPQLRKQHTRRHATVPVPYFAAKAAMNALGGCCADDKSNGFADHKRDGLSFGLAHVVVVGSALGQLPSC